jgi:hypothetical protein
MLGLIFDVRAHVIDAGQTHGESGVVLLSREGLPLRKRFVDPSRRIRFDGADVIGHGHVAGHPDEEMNVIHGPAHAEERTLPVTGEVAEVGIESFSQVGREERVAVFSWRRRGGYADKRTIAAWRMPSNAPSELETMGMGIDQALPGLANVEGPVGAKNWPVSYAKFVTLTTWRCSAPPKRKDVHATASASNPRPPRPPVLPPASSDPPRRANVGRASTRPGLSAGRVASRVRRSCRRLSPW